MESKGRLGTRIPYMGVSKSIYIFAVMKSTSRLQHWGSCRAFPMVHRTVGA